MIDVNKLKKWAGEIHANAVAHGWHEEYHSPEHYLGLIMTEVAEAVEADRKDKRVNEDAYLSQFVGHNTWYQNFVKGTVEEEFADIIIRLLDMSMALYGELQWYNFDGFFHGYGGVYYNRVDSFVENAWVFVHYQLNKNVYDIIKSIQFVYLWAEHLGIDLDQHIEWKMKYNTLREYKHGKKY